VRDEAEHKGDSEDVGLGARRCRDAAGVNERRLHELLHETAIPRADRARALDAVRRAYAERDRVSWPRRHARLLVLAAAAAAVIAAALSPPGRTVVDRIREAVGVEHAQRGLFSLPAPGRLVVSSGSGAWTVSQDGSTRRLGSYREASWSPFGRFVVAARPDELAALDPDGGVRWKLARPAVRFPRWGGTRTDTRIAYLSGTQLRVVAGDGTGDRLLASGVDAVAPAWRPGNPFVLTFARDGSVVDVDADTGRRLWQRRLPARELSWSPTGELLLVRGRRTLIVLDAGGHVRFDLLGRSSAPVEAAALGPDSDSAAFVQRAGGRSELWLIPALRADRSRAQRVFSGRGTFSGLAWAPNGRWLLVAWPEADQWLFLRADGVGAVRGVARIAEQFEGGFPMLGGWCCSLSSG
jgi:hypothetical protein